MKQGATEGGGGPAALSYIKETFIDKIKQIDKSVVSSLQKKITAKKGGKMTEYEKLKDKLSYL